MAQRHAVPADGKQDLPYARRSSLRGEHCRLIASMTQCAADRAFAALQAPAWIRHPHRRIRLVRLATGDAPATKVADYVIYAKLLPSSRTPAAGGLANRTQTSASTAACRRWTCQTSSEGLQKAWPKCGHFFRPDLFDGVAGTIAAPLVTARTGRHGPNYRRVSAAACPFGRRARGPGLLGVAEHSCHGYGGLYAEFYRHNQERRRQFRRVGWKIRPTDWAECISRHDQRVTPLIHHGTLPRPFLPFHKGTASASDTTRSLLGHRSTGRTMRRVPSGSATLLIVYAGVHPTPVPARRLTPTTPLSCHNHVRTCPASGAIRQRHCYQIRRHGPERLDPKIALGSGFSSQASCPSKVSQ